MAFAFFPTNKEILYGPLYKAISKQIPLWGGGFNDGVLTLEKETAFSHSDIALIEDLITAHDKQVELQKLAARELLVKQEREKKPGNLSDKERIARIELILGLD
jgi:hypothetical protein